MKQEFIKLPDAILKYCSLFDGIKELGNNEGFEYVYFKELGMTFLELIKTVGFKSGDKWCVYLAELIWKLGYSQYDSTMIVKLDKLFSASSTQTWKNFQASDFKCSEVPSVGALAIWQWYKNGLALQSGHTAIVTNFSPSIFKTLDGNSSDQVKKNFNTLTFEKVYTGKRLLGFVHLKE